jgi:hypothetical protein
MEWKCKDIKLIKADKDTVAPNKPAVNRVDNNDKVITGKAEAGSTVTLTI